jgi:hypothetical protein
MGCVQSTESPSRDRRLKASHCTTKEAVRARDDSCGDLDGTAPSGHLQEDHRASTLSHSDCSTAPSSNEREGTGREEILPSSPRLASTSVRNQNPLLTPRLTGRTFSSVVTRPPSTSVVSSCSPRVKPSEPVPSPRMVRTSNEGSPDTSLRKQLSFSGFLASPGHSCSLRQDELQPLQLPPSSVPSLHNDERGHQLSTHSADASPRCDHANVNPRVCISPLDAGLGSATGLEDCVLTSGEDAEADTPLEGSAQNIGPEHCDHRRNRGTGVGGVTFSESALLFEVLDEIDVIATSCGGHNTNGFAVIPVVNAESSFASQRAVSRRVRIGSH